MITTLFEKLSRRTYKEYTTCQLPGCSLPIDKEAGQKKYCCKEHAKKAQYMYIQEWNALHPDHVRLWKRRYARNYRKRLREGTINRKNK